MESKEAKKQKSLILIVTISDFICDPIYGNQNENCQSFVGLLRNCHPKCELFLSFSISFVYGKILNFTEETSSENDSFPLYLCASH